MVPTALPQPVIRCLTKSPTKVIQPLPLQHLTHVSPYQVHYCQQVFSDFENRFGATQRGFKSLSLRHLTPCDKNT